MSRWPLSKVPYLLSSVSHTEGGRGAGAEGGGGAGAVELCAPLGLWPRFARGGAGVTSMAGSPLASMAGDLSSMAHCLELMKAWSRRRSAARPRPTAVCGLRSGKSSGSLSALCWTSSAGREAREASGASRSDGSAMLLKVTLSPGRSTARSFFASRLPFRYVPKDDTSCHQHAGNGDRSAGGEAGSRMQPHREHQQRRAGIDFQTEPRRR